MLMFLSCICIVLSTPDMKLECLPADVFQATIFFPFAHSNFNFSQTYSFSCSFSVVYALHIGI